MNEAETRAEHIDPALKVAGWGVVEESRIRREYPITLGADAVADLGKQEEIGKVFSGFQRYLYQPQGAAA